MLFINALGKAKKKKKKNQWVKQKKKKKSECFFGRKPYRHSEAKPIMKLFDIID